MSRRAYDIQQWSRGRTVRQNVICPGCRQPIVFRKDHARCAEKWLKEQDAIGNPSNRRNQG